MAKNAQTSEQHAIRSRSARESSQPTYHQQDSTIAKETQINLLPSSTAQQYITTAIVLERLQETKSSSRNEKLIRRLEDHHATDATSFCDYTVIAEVVDASNFGKSSSSDVATCSYSFWPCFPFSTLVGPLRCFTLTPCYH